MSGFRAIVAAVEQAVEANPPQGHWCNINEPFVRPPAV
jgi:hypothetical protein